MSADFFKLDNYCKTSALLHGEQFKNMSILNLLGNDLEQWINEFLEQLGVGDQPLIQGQVADGAYVKGRVFVAENAKISETALVEGPCYIGPGAEVRHGAFIRGKVYVGPKAVVGHATEAKGSVFLDEAKAGHFAYVGDSILGRDTNLGAGTKLANLKLKGDEVRVKGLDGQLLSTGLRKLGAIMGDRSQTGCNAVLSPGTILMPGTLVGPCVHYRGTLQNGIIMK